MVFGAGIHTSRDVRRREDRAYASQQCRGLRRNESTFLRRSFSPSHHLVTPFVPRAAMLLRARRFRVHAAASLSLLGAAGVVQAQSATDASKRTDGATPTPAAAAAVSLRASPLLNGFRLDGRMDEAMWLTADSIGALTEVEPITGRVPNARTVVRILADANRIVIGVRADDPDAARIVSFARERDNSLANEDHIKVVLDTYLDGRSGYVFAVNPNGARYDALISGQGDAENANWDAVWDAATARTATGWSAEIVIPVRSLQFANGLTTWGLNVQRRVQRFLENDRWASPARDFKVTQTFRAGRLTNLPPFALGIGLSIRPASTGSSGVPAPGAARTDDQDASLDVTQTLGASTLAALTVNTDFAETEVDTRRTNLTRFPIVFPEKRTFFLQGSDIFDFGLGLGDDVRPFFSRRIGLLNGDEVPIRVGVKVTGRERGANFGGIGMRTGTAVAPTGTTLPSTANTLGVWRYKQNFGRESAVGMIGSVGDPIGRADSWMAGVDVNYQTSRFHGNKNLQMGAWGVQTDRAGLTGEKSAWGARIAYPNDLWNISAGFKRIGDGFDPSLGFVPRRAVQIIELTSDYLPRPRGRIAGLRVRQMVNEFRPRIVTDLRGTWESYRIFMAPINWRLESGDRFEVNANPTGERLVAPFTIAPGVTIPAGAYNWMRYRLEGGLAPKRRVSGQATWWFGSFYTGTLNEMILTTAWKPSSLFNLELNATRNIGHLREGSFTQDLFGTRIRINVSPNLQFNSYAQYDNQSDTFGANTRVRWTFSPLGDLFVVYNHNLRHDIDPATGLPFGSGTQRDPTTRAPQNWGFASNALLVKVQYAFRM